MEKHKWPSADAQRVADELIEALKPVTLTAIVAGSLRRRKPMVGDVEILYIPKFDAAIVPGEMFAQAEQNLADLTINTLILSGVLAKRTNANGSEMFGEKNKLVRHVATGIPVDLFATTEECWHNYLVCRTGGAETNKAICNAAIARGWKWNPYGAGFTHRESGNTVAVRCEQDVFRHVGLPFLNPEDRA